MRWDVIAGEYPPQHGGVGDYTARIAGGLAEAGAEVHVWTAAADAAPHSDARVTVHATGAGWGAAGRRVLEQRMQQSGVRGRMLVQYAPQAFGARGMNLGFCRWVLRQARAGVQVRVMFHEPFFSFGWQGPRRNAFAAVTHAMAATLLAAGDPVFISIPGWERLLRPLTSARRRFVWLPVPSSIPVAQDRRRVAFDAAHVIGHFGTYGSAIARQLMPVLREVLQRRDDVALLLLGAGGAEFRSALLALEPAAAARVHAPGRLDAGQLSAHLQSCDVAVQVYPDGVSSRRTTLMAWLEHGIPVVGNTGRFTESVWAEHDAVVLTEPSAMARAIAALLDNAEARANIARNGARLCHGRFSVDATVRTLLADGRA